MDIRTEYNTNGWIQVPDVVPLPFIQACRDHLGQVIDEVANTRCLDLSRHHDLNARFNALCDHDRSLGGMVYDCMRYHPVMQEMAAQPKVIDVLQHLLQPKKLFHVHDQWQFRIDRREEDRFQLQWHQDYWYNNTSTQAITVWIPLFDTTSDMGPVQFIDGSHRVVAKVKIDPQYKSRWDQNKLITLAEDIPYQAGRNKPCPAGSAVFLNALTMHRSGRNMSDRNRFSVVLRYADLFDKELIGKRWKAGIMPGHVTLINQRPDLIANMDELKATGAL